MIEQKELVQRYKRNEQKYLILLANQIVVIDSEFEAMKKARRQGSRIVDMFPTFARAHCQITSLEKLLDSLELTTINHVKESYRKESLQTSFC